MNTNQIDEFESWSQVVTRAIEPLINEIFPFWITYNYNPGAAR